MNKACCLFYIGVEKRFAPLISSPASPHKRRAAPLRSIYIQDYILPAAKQLFQHGWHQLREIFYNSGYERWLVEQPAANLCVASVSLSWSDNWMVSSLSSWNQHESSWRKEEMVRNSPSFIYFFFKFPCTLIFRTGKCLQHLILYFGFHLMHLVAKQPVISILCPH